MLSKEAGELLSLIEWVARKNEQLFAVIGMDALIRNMAKHCDSPPSENDIELYISELVSEKSIMIEEIGKYRKFWLTNPIFTDFLNTINDTLSQLEHRGRSFKIATHILAENILYYSIEIKYSINLEFVTFPKFSEYLYSDQPFETESFMRELIRKLLNFEMECIKPIIRNYEHAVHQLGDHNET